ncbi:Stf0 family sulfotransferase [Coleofasciculus sp.]|uniref:Stf0 family sulfotransferase n=1 Tax=Coleofasciculus sp. TaxID=3100458 RepID=UPI0039FB6EE2
MINKSYIVCSTGRSGSTLLCSTLSDLGFCGKPLEYFHPAKIEKYIAQDSANGFQDYLSQVLQKGTSQNGIFGIKIHWEHFRNFINLARKYLGLSRQSDWQIISTIFPNPYFIYIWRRNLVKQAVSTEIAYQTQKWVKTNENLISETPKKISF